MTSIFWRRIADYSQRGISITLVGLTVLGLVILAQEGQGVMYRRKQGKALKNSIANTDNQVSYQTDPLVCPTLLLSMIVCCTYMHALSCVYQKGLVASI